MLAKITGDVEEAYCQTYTHGTCAQTPPQKCKHRSVRLSWMTWAIMNNVIGAPGR
jgi:hypothetical protein